MPLYFSNTADQDPNNANNWWDGVGGTGTNGTPPSGSDDCIIEAGQTCSTSNFAYLSLTVDGTLTSNDSGKTVASVSGIGVVTDNYGTISSNVGTIGTNASTGVVTSNTGTVTTNAAGGTVGDNYGVVTYNNGGISNRQSGGSTTYEYEIGSNPAGYTVFSLLASDSGIINNGTITNLNSAIGTNNGTIVDIGNTGQLDNNAGGVTANHGSITLNSGSGTVTTNYGQVYENSGTVTTNHSSGTVTNNNYTGTIANQNGTLRIGNVTGGSGNLAAASTTNLSSQTAGANVTLPTGNTTWW
jgi:hypothetical protein